MKDVIVTVRKTSRSQGITLTYANGVYIGSYNLDDAQIAALKEGGRFHDYRIRRIRRPKGWNRNAK